MEEYQWLKILLAFVCILDVAISVLTFTLWNKRDLMAACFNAVTQLPKYKSEVPLESRLGHTKMASVISHLVSSGLTLGLALSPYALSFVIVVFNLEDPTFYLFRPLSFIQSFQLDKAMRAFILTLLICNRFLSLINYVFLLIMLASRVLLVQLTILQPPNGQSEVRSILANKKVVNFISHLVSSAVTSAMALSPYVVPSIIIVYNLEEPTFYFFEFVGLPRVHILSKVLSPIIFTVLFINRFYSTLTYFILVIMLASRILLLQLTILQPPNDKLTPTLGQRSFIGTFNRKLLVYRRVHLIFKYFNEMGAVTHSLMMTIAFLTLVVAGSGVILGNSHLSIPSYLFPIFPAYFVFILGLLLAALPIGANIYENSVWFRYVWMKVGGYERKYVRKQLVCCIAFKAEVGVMGFVDRSYIMTYSDALLNNIVNVVMYVTETQGYNVLGLLQGIDNFSERTLMCKK
ncbi:unnamed protein product [Orchesella dallaii]|uniref:Odorant receptor n=1 Tax=Orchesella dallaii TaxID=48710 RepID=A0ABP1Q3G0_9HEXA